MSPTLQKGVKVGQAGNVSCHPFLPAHSVVCVHYPDRRVNNVTIIRSGSSKTSFVGLWSLARLLRVIAALLRKVGMSSQVLLQRRAGHVHRKKREMLGLPHIIDPYGCRPKQNFWEGRVHININIFIYKQSKRTNWKKISECNVGLIEENRDDIAIYMGANSDSAIG